MENNKKNKLEYSSLEDLELQHSNILSLIKNPENKKTLTQQRKIFQLQLKGLEYFEDTYKSDISFQNKEVEYTDNLKKLFVRLGMELEKKELLFENNAKVLEKTENQLKIESLVEKIHNELGLENENKLKNELPKPELKPEIKKEEKEFNLEEELQNKETDIQVKTELNEEAIAKELTQKAKIDGDLKEAKLNNTPTTENGQVASSLVVDMDTNKIANVIQQMDERLNSVKHQEPLQKEEPVIKKEVQEEKEENSNKQKKKKDPSPSKIEKKKEAPKPTPHQTQKKKKDKKIEEPKPQLSSATVAAKVTELTQQFRDRMEKDPTIVEQEKFETVIRPGTPVFQDRNRISNNIFAMRARSMDVNAPAPEVVENQYGTQEVKTKRKLR